MAGEGVGPDLVTDKIWQKSESLEKVLNKFEKKEQERIITFLATVGKLDMALKVKALLKAEPQSEASSPLAKRMALGINKRIAKNIQDNE